MMQQIASRFETEEGPEFPCVFAQNAFARGNILCLPVPFKDKGYDLKFFYDGLKDYLEDCLKWDGSVNTAQPLLVLFEPVAHLSSTSDYQELFISSMQYLIDHDPIPWVDGTPTAPEREFWSMCFQGQQIFVNVSHPQNLKRRSRNLCDCMVLVINPRERFDIVAGIHKKGFAMRQKIRENIDLYDDVPRSPLLGHYESGDLEWPQYMLPDDNETPPLRCPLKFRQVEEIG
ncbi:YqcI/YcgG family protein [Rhizobium helianthi]|uniref:YqcI/YcgG family protein n=1 Tax=Rhizobium helianthi TaxID=1132695 RepID=A0ABW4M8V9_9HYPH